MITSIDLISQQPYKCGNYMINMKNLLGLTALLCASVAMAAETVPAAAVAAAAKAAATAAALAAMPATTAVATPAPAPAPVATPAATPAPAPAPARAAAPVAKADPKADLKTDLKDEPKTAAKLAVKGSGCIVANFKSVALTVHEPLARSAKAFQWLQQNAGICSLDQLMFIRDNRASWLGTSDSPAMAALIDATVEAKAGNNPGLLAEIYGGRGKDAKLPPDNIRMSVEPMLPNMMPPPVQGYGYPPLPQSANSSQFQYPGGQAGAYGYPPPGYGAPQAYEAPQAYGAYPPGYGQPAQFPAR